MKEQERMQDTLPQLLSSRETARQTLSPLSPHWAFVVQFRTETQVEAGHLRGRVEHVVSGQATHFQSLEELLAFIGRVLAALPAGSAR